MLIFRGEAGYEVAGCRVGWEMGIRERGLGGTKREGEFGFVGKKMGVDDLGKMDKAEMGGRGKYERVDKESKDYFEGPRKVGGGKGEKLDDKGRLCTPGLSGLGLSLIHL